MARVREDDLAALLLVEAIEKADPAAFSLEAKSEAGLAAVAAPSDAELLARRSAVLLRHTSPALRAWLRAARIPERALGICAGAAFVLGALANYLGPSQRVHVALNPLMLLVLWNLAVYAALARRRTRPPRAHPHGLLRALFAAQRRIAATRGGRGAVARVERIAGVYWSAYWRVAGGLISARVAAILHAAAIALLAGALCGIYVRGVFFDYRAVWASTWFEAEGIARLLNLVLGPACLVLDGRTLDATSARSLLAPEGTDAGFWIHRLALTAVLVVGLPRAALAIAASLRARRAAAAIEVDFSDPYYVETLRSVREGVIHRVRDEIAAALRREVERVVADLAGFVEAAFFDRRVAPALRAFRERGGRVAELEAELQRERGEFEPELEAELRVRSSAFQEGVSSALRAIAGAELGRSSMAGSELKPAAQRVGPELGREVAAQFGAAVALAAATAASAAVATISGGLGKTLGVAIVSALLHTSGPVGMLIGGVAALATAGTAYAFGRERVTAAAKQWRIPAPLAAVALRDAKIERARADARAQVARSVEVALEPQIAGLGESLLRELARA